MVIYRDNVMVIEMSREVSGVLRGHEDRGKKLIIVNKKRAKILG